MSRRRSWEVISTADYVTIGEIVQLSGLRYSTLKHYTEEGMLPFLPTETKLTRRYPRQASLDRLQEIRRRREAGESILEIKTHLETQALASK